MTAPIELSLFRIVLFRGLRRKERVRGRLTIPYFSSPFLPSADYRGASLVAGRYASLEIVAWLAWLISLSKLLNPSRHSSRQYQPQFGQLIIADLWPQQHSQWRTLRLSLARLSGDSGE